MTRPDDDRMPPEQRNEWKRLIDRDDHGRRDLCGGIGYVLIGAVAFWGAVLAWGIL